MTGFVVYFFLFLALYFEVFFVLAFFGREARKRREPRSITYFPSVSVIVPCHNEETTVGATIVSLLALEYPKDKLKLILVDDGSTDKTLAVLNEYANNPQIRILSKEKGGKHTAMNAAIALADTELIGCLDADSFVDVGALREVVSHFNEDRIAAVTSAISIYEPKSPLELMQHVEFLLGIMLRHVLGALNGIYVTPGPLTIFRKKALDAVGSFKHAHNTEDMEMALRLQKGGWKIQNAPQARVYTKAPKTVLALIKQRTRWTTGFLRNTIDYREFLGNRRYRILGMVILPLGIISIYSGIVLTSLAWIEAGTAFMNFLIRASAVPLSFLFRLPPLDWFFAPTSTLGLLSLVAVAIMLTCAYLGALISGTKSRFGPSIFWYVILYCLIAPFWMVRSVVDVAFGVRRSWHS